MKASMKIFLISGIFILFSFQIIFSTRTQSQPRFISDDDIHLSHYKLVSRAATKNSFKFILHHALQKKIPKMKEKLVATVSEFIELEIFLISQHTVQFIFKDANRTRVEMPLREPFPFHSYTKEANVDLNMNNNDYDYELTLKENPFSFTLQRKLTKEIIFSTVNKPIIFLNNYSEISTDLPSENIFGLGERTTSFKLRSGTYTLYNHDLYGVIEDGKGKGVNKYGSHPMYLMREQGGDYHVSYLRNTLPMDVTVDHLRNQLTYKIAGGVLDFTFFLGDKNPETSTKMYHKFLGGFTLPPFWAMGFHQCRWGYKNLTMIQEVLEAYKVNNLPLDTIWMDIDYMRNYMPFSVDESRYDLEDFNSTLQHYNKRFVMIAEPSMGTKWENYKWLKKGYEMGIFIKNNEGLYLLNKVWPGICHFIDFFNPKAKEYWFEGMGSLHQKLGYSGIWLDMNEIATFQDGQMDYEEQKIKCRDYQTYPYKAGGADFEKNTICPNARHYGNVRHIEVHNYYPVMQAATTFQLLEELYPDQYPFILTRANAPGIGKYAAHWSGDNYGTFSFYKLSVSEVLNFNLYGVPMAGADICGFGGDTPEILCSKWYQMGSLYPFSRSHAHLDSYRKEPFKMGPTLLQTTLKSLQFRYSILKYYYALFIATWGTGTIFRPLFFEFYDDINTLSNSIIDNYFMIGNSLLAVPNFHDDDYSTTTLAYFPRGKWFDMRDHTQVPKTQAELGEYINIQTTLNEAPAVYLRSGRTIFTSDVEHVSNSYDLDNNYNILIAIGEDLTSEGKIPAMIDYNSKTTVQRCMKFNCFIDITTEFILETRIIKIKFTKPKFFEATLNSKLFIKKFIIYGIPGGLDVNILETNISKYLDASTPIQSDVPLYVAKVLNKNCFEIILNSNLVIQRDEINITFKLNSNLIIQKDEINE